MSVISAGKSFAVIMLVTASLLHASRAKAAEPCLPHSIYAPMIVGGSSQAASKMWRQSDADFNGDGCADLAIGAPGEDITDNTHKDGGAVNVLYGFTSGLTAAGDQIWTQDSPGENGSTGEDDDQFGFAVAAGDFNGDGFSDLAIGVPYEDIADNKEDDAGAVNVFYGSRTGLTAAGSQAWTQDSPGVNTTAGESGDHFGMTVASGDFNGDGYDDLAIGAPGEDIVNNTVADGGAVNVLYGSRHGLTASGEQVWTQGKSGVVDRAEDNDEFGSALAAGDFDGDGFADLAVGVPLEDRDHYPNSRDYNDAGMVNVIFGSSKGLTTERNLFLEAPGARESGDEFGFALAAGDFDCDGDADLAVSEVGRGGGLISDGVGDVIVFTRFDDVGYSSHQRWDQGTDGIGGSPEKGDRFGAALVAGDFDGDSCDDLAIGAPGEDIVDNAENDGGAVNVLYGSRLRGLERYNSQIWTQGASGVKGKPEEDDEFGYALTAGDYDADGYTDLAVGVPGEGSTLFTDGMGAVNILYGSDSGLTTNGDQMWDQNTQDVAGESEKGDRFGSALR